MIRTYLGIVTTGALALVLVLVVLGHVMGQPMGLAFVTSGSMEPTIDEGDGYVPIPTQLTGEMGTGDVVVFEAQEVGGGGPTVHRVVERTDQGYITQGDANPFTDQDSGEPYVTEDRVYSQALTIGGWVVTIPNLGTAITSVRATTAGGATAVAGLVGVDSLEGERTGLVLAAVGLLLLALSFRRGDDGDAPEREVTRSTTKTTVTGRKIALFLVIVVLVPANAAMFVPSGTTEIVVDSEAVPAGEDRFEADVSLSNPGMITMVAIVEPTDSDVTAGPTALNVPGGSESTIAVHGPAPPDGGERTIEMTERYYLGVLPDTLLFGLHDIHPLAPVAAVNAFFATAITVVVVGLFGTGTVRGRQTSRSYPLPVRLKQAIRTVVIE